MQGNGALLCSTGALFRPGAGFEVERFEEYAGQLECDGLELMVSARWYDEFDRVREVLGKSKGLYRTIHIDKRIGEAISRNEPGDIDQALERFELNCSLAQDLGIGLGVFHLWGGEPSDKHIDVNIALFPQLHQAAQAYGLTLLVENIVCNQQSALVHMRTLHKRHPDLARFTVDTRQAAFHEMLEETMRAGFLWENGLVAHVHVSDYDGGYMQWERVGKALHPGEGHVDFETFFKGLKAHGYRGMIALESRGFDGDTFLAARLNESFRFLRSRI